MPDFKTQITGLTDITIDENSSPTQDEVSQFLVDGTAEVANRITSIQPAELVKFTTSTENTDGSGTLVTGKVYSVVREHDSTTILRKCDIIDADLRYDATDPDSLNFRSKYNPGYYVLDGKIHTVPASGGSNNSSWVTQTYYATNTGHTSTSIENFPNEYVYLVVLYASMKTLQNKMGSLASNADVTTAITNTNTALDKISDSIFNVADNYDAATKRFKQVKKALDNASKLFDGDFPSALSDTESYLRMEDPEMVEANLSAIQVQASVAEKALTELNVLVDLPLKEAQGYMAEVSSRLGILNQDYSWWNAKYKELKAEYDGAFLMMAPKQRAQNES